MVDWNMSEAISPYIIAAASGYVVAQVGKSLIYFSKRRKFSWRSVFQSGNMPSSHTASTVALATTIGLLDGLNTAQFAMAALFSAVVIYDATHVRRAVGEQGEVLRGIIERDAKQELEIAKLTPDPKDRGGRKFPKPYFARGHKPTEVFVGGVIGIIIGTTISLIATSI